MGEIKFITGLVMAALFIIAITTFLINFANDNNAAIDIEDADGFTTMNTQAKDNLTNFIVTSVNTSSTTFEETSLKAGDDVMTEGATFKTGRKSLLGTIKSFLPLIRTYIFGGNSELNIFLTAIFSLLTFIGIRYVYKSWVGKNPD